MIVSVLTPSYNMLGYLRRCAASVRDQGISGLDIEHIVVDGASTDGTAEWLTKQHDIRFISEPDDGMYDALNKGLALARGDVIAYLNCDEQYLDGSIAHVLRSFAARPSISLAFGGVLLIRPDGTLLAARPAYRPSWRYIASSHLYLLSAGMFFRRTLLEAGMSFDSGLRDAGDAKFVMQALRMGFGAAYVPQYVAAFTVTGSNMSGGRNARSEADSLLRRAPASVRAFRWAFVAARRLEKMMTVGYVRRPVSYSVYPCNVVEGRRTYAYRHAPWRWPRLVDLNSGE